MTHDRLILILKYGTMRKEDYMARKARMDFIRYAMLQSPGLTETEVSAKLRTSLGLEETEGRLREQMEQTLDRHLGADRLKDENGKAMGILPLWLRPGLANKIADEYRNEISGIISQRSPLGSVMDEIEKLTWIQGVDEMARNVRRFLADMASDAAAYGETPRMSREDFDLEAKYEAAKRVTIRERLANDNYLDVESFRIAVLGYARILCEDELHRRMERLLDEVARSSELGHLVSWYEIAAEEAGAELKRLEVMERDEEWDADYEARVPLKFFRRHVEEIDEGKAFRMMFLLALARHEDYLAGENFVRRNGELRIFTSPHFLSSRWSSIDFTIVMR